jgi:hypothetical protein
MVDSTAKFFCPGGTMRKKLAATLGVFTFCVLMAAQDPVVDIDKRVHPNLSAAQQHIVEANRYIALVQRDNRYHDDVKGHAERARQHLMEADQELKAAAQAANAEKR